MLTSPNFPNVGVMAAEDYLGDGYLEEALVNFVALLGWNPGQGTTQEIFTLDELVEQFELSNVREAGAVFESEELDWLNGEYMRRCRWMSYIGESMMENFWKKS